MILGAAILVAVFRAGLRFGLPVHLQFIAKDLDAAAAFHVRRGS